MAGSARVEGRREEEREHAGARGRGRVSNDNITTSLNIPDHE